MLGHGRPGGRCEVGQHAHLGEHGADHHEAVEHRDLAVAEVPEVGAREVDPRPRWRDDADRGLQWPEEGALDRQLDGNGVAEHVDPVQHPMDIGELFGHEAGNLADSLAPIALRLAAGVVGCAGVAQVDHAVLGETADECGDVQHAALRRAVRVADDCFVVVRHTRIVASAGDGGIRVIHSPPRAPYDGRANRPTTVGFVDARPRCEPSKSSPRQVARRSVVCEEDQMLIRLLRRFLRGYWLVLVSVLLLQGVQALASLYLPDLNASVIDKGVLRGDTGYIERLGVVMVVVTAVQLGFSIGAVYLGSRVAMAFGRDVRQDLFRQVTAFSAQEVNRFGAPSLITRITNDVQQVQMLVLMTSTLAVAAPVTAIGGLVLALRQARSLSWLLAVSLPVLVAGLVVIVSR